MLESIHLKNVGPAPEMRMDLAPRLNLITGDNGLGKSFLLDVAWWALTRTWAREMAIPAPGVKAEIAYAYTKRTPGSYRKSSTFDASEERWTADRGRPPIAGLILYAQVDGAFSVWDPARNYWKDDASPRPDNFRFMPHEVWEGNGFCEGLIRDWGSWQREKSPSFTMLVNVLEALSPSERELLKVGELRKLTGSDPKRYPTLRMPYGEEVAVVHASAGMRRILALAYLLVWAWEEHRAAAHIRGETPTREIVFVIDEIEAHLHPQWQRRIVPAILKVMDALIGAHGSKVQLIAATHSPLVLASVESLFDAECDAWFDLDLVHEPGPAHVVLERRDYVRHGEVGNWLTSEAFNLESSRSLEAERVLEEAAELLSAPQVDRDAAMRLDTKLRQVLGDIDPFWARWRFVGERKGWLESEGADQGDGGQGR